MRTWWLIENRFDMQADSARAGKLFNWSNAVIYIDPKTQDTRRWRCGTHHFCAVVLLQRIIGNRRCSLGDYTMPPRSPYFRARLIYALNVRPKNTDVRCQTHNLKLCSTHKLRCALHVSISSFWHLSLCDMFSLVYLLMDRWFLDTNN